MPKNALQIECQYTGKENIQQLILQSFQLRSEEHTSELQSR